MYKKPIIVFEGIEGSGKTTHIKSVLNYLKNKKIKFINLREPGGNKNSELIRNIILNKKSDLHIVTDLLLYLAARNENINKIIKKNYKKKVIIIDRFVDSTIAYQHYGMGVDLKLIYIVNDFLLKNININFTFLNLVNQKNMKERLLKRKKLNRYDQFNARFYRKVQNGYIKIMKKNPKKYMIINSNLNILKNKKIILSKIEKLIS